MVICLFHSNRWEMLDEQIEHLEGCDLTVFDDSDEKRNVDCNILFNNRRLRKGRFWEQWQKALTHCRSKHSNLYVFMPDDFLYLDIDRIKRYSKQMPKGYLFNLINDGRECNWNNKPKEPFHKEYDRSYFTDCGFFCDRKALQDLQFKMIPIHHNKTKNRSSGVGRQITQRLQHLHIFTPKTSLAFHGDHPSVMHPSEREQNPLYSIF